MLGVSTRIIPVEPIETHKDQDAERVLQRVLKSRNPRIPQPECLPPGTSMYYHYKSSKHNEPIEWRPGSVISAKRNFVQNQNEKGRISNVSYEDIKAKAYLKAHRRTKLWLRERLYCLHEQRTS